MLQESSPPPGDVNACVIETARLVLRPPVLVDAAAIARLANNRRIAEMTRRLPHPYREDDAARFIAAVGGGESVFLIERAGTPIGVVGINWGGPDAPELGYWLGVAAWGQGFATEAARAVIDFAFEEFSIDRLNAGARVVNPSSRHVLEKCGFQWTGVEINRFAALEGSTPVDCFRLTRAVWSSLKGWQSARRRVAP